MKLIQSMVVPQKLNFGGQLFLHINKTGISGGSTCQKLASSCSLGHASLLSEMTHHYWKLYIGNPDKTSMVARCQNM